MVVEEKEKYVENSACYPDYILLIDRSFTQDTQGEKTLEGTTLLHEIALCATDVPTTLSRNWLAKVSNLLCICQFCVVDCINTAYQYTLWRKASKITVIEGLSEREMAIREPFEGLNVIELKDLVRENNLAQGDRKIELMARLVGAGVQDMRIQ